MAATPLAFSCIYPILVCCSSMPGCLGWDEHTRHWRGLQKNLLFFFAFKDGLIVHFFLQSAGLCTSPWLEIIFFPASVLTSLLPTTPASYSSLPSLQMIFFFEILSSKTGREKQRGKKKVLALPFSPSTCPWIYFSRAWDGASSILEWARPKKGWGQKINIWA